MNKILAGMIFGDGGGGGGGANIQPTKTATVNGTVTPDEGYDALAQVVVNVSGGITPTGTINITTNGTHDVTQYASASVAVPQANIQSTKTVTSNGTVTPDEGYDALAQVIVNVSGGGAFAKGSVTLTTGGTDPVTIEHGLGVAPNCIVFLTGTTVGGSTEYLKGGWLFNGFLGGTGTIQDQNKVAFATQYNSWRSGYVNSQVIDNIDEDYFDITPTSSLPIPNGGCTFFWFALHVDTTQ